MQEREIWLKHSASFSIIQHSGSGSVTSQWQELKQSAPDARVGDIVMLIVTCPSSAAMNTGMQVTLLGSVRSCDSVLTANVRVIPIATVPNF